MTLTHSNMLPLGTPLANLELPDLDGDPVSLVELRGPGVLVVVFACNHCPYVRHVEDEIGRIAADFDERDVSFAAICSNDVGEYPDDGVAGLRNQAGRAGWHFPYLVDSDQSAALTLRAACTPDFFVFDRQGLLAYRGALDESSPGNELPLNGHLLRQALILTISGQPVPEPHRPAMGCNIKWLPGVEPA